MLKLFKTSLLFILMLTSFAYADQGPDTLIEYRSKISRTISGINDNLAGRCLSILLSDGTLWDCFYRSMSDRQKILTYWEIGQSVQIHPDDSAYSDGYCLASSSNIAGSLVIGAGPA
jgi:hypothetical protein